MNLLGLVGGAVLTCAGARWLYRQGRFEHTAASARPSQQTRDGSVETVYFESAGTRLEAWLFEPHAATRSIVLMAHGLAGTKDCLLEPFAWQFVRNGAAVLLFDFRTLGGSDGLPRHWVDPFRQMEDYEAALRFARERYEQVVLWGSSFSGGQVLCVAAKHPDEVDAVIAHAPFLATPPQLEPTGWTLGGFALLAALDVALARLAGGRLPPVYLAAYGKPDEFAFARSPECPSKHDADWHDEGPFWKALPKSVRGGWENVICARMLVRIQRFTPLKVLDDVNCPVLLVGARRDTLLPVERLSSAVQVLRDGRLRLLDCKHFDLYVDPVLPENLAIQGEFLQHVLSGAATRSTTDPLPRSS